jgi:hypothetical protein
MTVILYFEHASIDNLELTYRKTIGAKFLPTSGSRGR